MIVILPSSSFSVLLSRRSGGKCSHTTALLYKLHDLSAREVKEIPAETSCTSAEQQWHKPRESTIAPDPVMKCVFAKSQTDQHGARIQSPVKCRLYDPRRGEAFLPIGTEDLNWQRCQMPRPYSGPPFSYLVANADENAAYVSTPFGNAIVGSPLSYQLQDFDISHIDFITSNLTDPNFEAPSGTSFPSLPLHVLQPNIVLGTLIPDHWKDFLGGIRVSLSQAQVLESQTVQQRKSLLWHENRRKRLTASNLGLVILRKSTPSQAFLRNLLSKKKIDQVPAVSHGIHNENEARKLYVKKMMRVLRHMTEVYHSGLIINPGVPYLGASPDGKVFDKSSEDMFGLIEIKCPYKFRNLNVRDAVLDSAFCLEYVDSDSGPMLRLKRNHAYYFQVQGQMALSGLGWCDFVVYTFQSLFVERIMFDSRLWNEVMLPCLHKFYFNHALPYLLADE